MLKNNRGLSPFEKGDCMDAGDRASPGAVAEGLGIYQ